MIRNCFDIDKILWQDKTLIPARRAAKEGITRSGRVAPKAQCNMNTIDTLKVEQRLIALRKKWSEAKKKEDITMMNVIERQARALKLSYGNS